MGVGGDQTVGEDMKQRPYPVTTGPRLPLFWLSLRVLLLVSLRINPSVAPLFNLCLPNIIPFLFLVTGYSFFFEREVEIRLSAFFFFFFKSALQIAFITIGNACKFCYIVIMNEMLDFFLLRPIIESRGYCL